MLIKITKLLAQRSFGFVIQKRAIKMAEGVPSCVKPQNFKYLLILDFEATCDNSKKIVPQEIIEFPVIKLNTATLTAESIFHQYVQPRVHPQLTPFCTELTGIIQDMVDGQPHLEEVMERFHKWMLAEDLLNPEVSFTFVTCGDWDLNTMLPKQCDYFNIPVPKYFQSWINIKKAFAEATGFFPKGMMPMLSKLDLPHQGRHHSGIDDCRNIARIAQAMLEKGYVFHTTSSRQQAVAQRK